MNNIDYISDKNSDDFKLKSNKHKVDNSLIKVYEKYPLIKRIPINYFSKYDFHLKNGLIDYIRDDYSYFEVSTKCNKKLTFKRSTKFNLKLYDILVLKFNDDTELGIVINFFYPEDNLIIYKFTELIDIEIIRKATESDFNFFNNKYKNEDLAKKTVNEIIQKYNFEMKITDVRWQSDRQKITIFFTAPNRIDFRELVKDLAKLFKTRIEMRQISAREEAKRLGNFIGPCGRDLCCSAFLNNFEHITLEHARIQQLAHNLTKLTGNCGRLKCCLNYEYDVYKKVYEKLLPIGTTIYKNENTYKIKKIDFVNEKLEILNLQDNNTQYINFENLQQFIKDSNIVKPLIYSHQYINNNDIEDLSNLEG